MSKLLDLLLLDAVIRGQGIYPKSTTVDNVTTERTEWQEGWNAARMAITKERLIAMKQVQLLPDEHQAMLEELLEKCHLQIDIENEKVSFSLNMNDTFYYACADSEEVPMMDIPVVHHIWKELGYDGLVAWAALRREEEPIIECQTETYKLAVRLLKA